MKPGVAGGARASFAFTMTPDQTVPALYPVAPAFRAMPGVLATGGTVGLMDRACLDPLAPCMQAGEGAPGTRAEVSRSAPTPPGLTVTAETEVTASEGRSVWFRVRAHDGVDLIGEGRHQRAVVKWDRFVPRAMAKAQGVA
jgi:fluoroacetyl-CoA thioesterase